MFKCNYREGNFQGGFLGRAGVPNSTLSFTPLELLSSPLPEMQSEREIHPPLPLPPVRS